MGRKTVRFELKSHPLSREENGVVFGVADANDGKVGDLTVSQGGVRWRPRGQQHDYYLNWGAFDKMILEQGQKKRR